MSTSETPTGDPHDTAIIDIMAEFTQVFAFARSRWAKFAEELHPELRAQGLMVLQTIIRREPISATELAQLLNLDKAIVSRQVSQLRDLGFVEATPSEADRRVFLLTSTKAAVRAIEDMRASSATAYHERFKEWEMADLSQLRSLLQRFNRERTVPCRADHHTENCAHHSGSCARVADPESQPALHHEGAAAQ